MSMMKIEVVPDQSVHTGGHAIIRLRGVALLPPGATFRIEPIDDTLADEEGWPQGEILPIETRQTPDGLELRVGPEVVDAPLLEPGMPVTITVDDAQLSAELVWPNLPMSAVPVTAPVVMSAAQMAAEFAAAERARAEAQRRAAEAEAERERLRQEAKEAELARPAAALEAAVFAPVSDFANGMATGDDPALDPAHIDEPMHEAARQLDAVLAIAPPVAPAARHGEADEALSTLAKGGGNARSTDDTDTLSRLNRSTGEPALRNGAVGSGGEGGHERDGTLPAIVMKQATEAAEAARSTPLAPVRPIDPPVVVQPKGGRLLAFLGGLVTAAAAVALIVLLTPPKTLATYLPGAKTPTAKIVLADAFVAGPQSPRGEIASDVDLPTALKLADYNLHGVDRPVDRAEAEYWLKKALSLTASHTQLRWAMTQLGTLAAQPVKGEPDYEKARLLWEISAGNGDPIALCFLGTLAENGLGGSPDRMKALEYYKRAKEIGGCPTSDEAIARLSR